MPFRLYLPLHLALASVGILALVLAPPPKGTMLLVPIGPRAADGLAAQVIARGARLAGVGPIEGSLVVVGDRDRIVTGLWRRGVIATTGAAAQCDGPSSWR